jgi:hypothetical protein
VRPLKVQVAHDCACSAWAAHADHADCRRPTSGRAKPSNTSDLAPARTHIANFGGVGQPPSPPGSFRERKALGVLGRPAESHAPTAATTQPPNPSLLDPSPFPLLSAARRGLLLSRGQHFRLQEGT